MTTFTFSPGDGDKGEPPKKSPLYTSIAPMLARLAPPATEAERVEYVYQLNRLHSLSETAVQFSHMQISMGGTLRTHLEDTLERFLVEADDALNIMGLARVKALQRHLDPVEDKPVEESDDE